MFHDNFSAPIRMVDSWNSLEYSMALTNSSALLCKGDGSIYTFSILPTASRNTWITIYYRTFRIFVESVYYY